MSLHKVMVGFTGVPVGNRAGQLSFIGEFAERMIANSDFPWAGRKYRRSEKHAAKA